MKKIFSLLASLAIFVLLCFMVFHYMRNVAYDNQRSALQQAQSMAEIQQRLEDSEARLLPEHAFFADMSREFGAFQPESNTVAMTLRFVPKENYAHMRDAVVRCNGTDLSLVRDDAGLTASYSATIAELQNISSITFADGDTMQSLDLFWTIDPTTALLPKLTTTVDLNTKGKTLSGLQYSGTLRSVVLDLPTNAGTILDVHVITLVDGTEQTRSAVKLPAQSAPFSPFIIEKKVKGRIPDGSTIELMIELNTSNGMRYQNVVQRIDAEGNGLWDSLNTMRVYNEKGTLLLETI